jgi:hypothetical protein
LRFGEERYFAAVSRGINNHSFQRGDVFQSRIDVQSGAELDYAIVASGIAPSPT